MEIFESHSQRRAIVGDRHFILADPAQPDRWALAGTQVTGVDENRNRSFGPLQTISTEGLRAWAAAMQRPFRIEEAYPLVRGDAAEAVMPLAA